MKVKGTRGSRNVGRKGKGRRQKTENRKHHELKSSQVSGVKIFKADQVSSSPSYGKIETKGLTADRPSWEDSNGKTRTKKDQSRNRQMEALGEKKKAPNGRTHLSGAFMTIKQPLVRTWTCDAAEE